LNTLYNGPPKLRSRALAILLIVEYLFLVDTIKKKSNALMDFVCKKYDEIFYGF